MSAISQETVVDKAVAHLRERILSQSLAPGTALREEALAKELGVSRPTLREAFKLLESEGLASRRPTSRTLEVIRIDETEIREIYRARTFIELAGVEQAAHATEDELAQLNDTVGAMRDAADAHDYTAFVQADVEVHRIVAGFLRSRYLSELHSQLMRRMRLVHTQAERGEAQSLEDTVALHQDFVDRVRSGDLAAAAAGLRERLEASEQVIVTIALQASEVNTASAGPRGR